MGRELCNSLVVTRRECGVLTVFRASNHSKAAKTSQIFRFSARIVSLLTFKRKVEYLGLVDTVFPTAFDATSLRSLTFDANYL